MNESVYPTGLAAVSLRGGRTSDVVLMLMVLSISGNPAALRPLGHEATYAAVAILLGTALLLSRGVGGRAGRAFLPVWVVFVTLSIVHAYSFDFFPIITVLGFLTRVFIGMAVVMMVFDFAGAYVVAMVVLSSLGLLLWLPEYIGLQLGLRFHDLFRPLASVLVSQADDRWSLGIHTYLMDPAQMHRNSGIFWEPGAFAGYIVVALLMLAAIRPSLTRKTHQTMLCILSGALISTFSTAGYIAFPIALLLNYGSHGRKRLLRPRVSLAAYTIVPIVILVFFYAFTKVEFLQVKIRRQIAAVERQEYGWQINRFGTLVFNWEYISKRPLTGWGLHDRTRMALHPWVKNEGFGNGMADFVVKFGFIGFGTFILGVLRGARHIGGKSIKYVLGFLAVIMIVLQGEPFLGFPFFLGLMFLHHASLPSYSLAMHPAGESAVSVRVNPPVSSWRRREV